mmetsp:Transcript_45199/g.57885  ORF Transcript_45199/g.57885 Transcript_45199/m.57885 type:complete len:430 (+) Transcript_45199:416-1705(+)
MSLLVSDVSFRPLFDYAKELVPESLHHSTTLHLKATAGVRLLPSDTQRFLLDGLIEELSIEKRAMLGCPFIINNEDIGVISGDDEGFYAAMSVNYLKGSVGSDLSQQAKTNLFGALDMGGASTQIVFKQSDNIEPHQEKEEKQEEPLMQEVEISMSTQQSMQVNYHARPPSRVNSSSIQRDDFFSQSFLSFGADQIREKYWNYLLSRQMDPAVEERREDTKVSNPCAFVGLEVDWHGQTLVGTGDTKECALHIRHVLSGGGCSTTQDNQLNDKGEEGGSETLTEERCPLEGHAHVPEVEGVEFVAMSIYFFALDCMRSLSHLLEGGDLHDNHIDFAQQWPSPSIDSLLLASQAFCETPWEKVSSPDVFHRWTWDDQMPHRCFETVFIATLLKEGFGIHPEHRTITYALELEGMEVEWTLGYLLSKISGF